MNLRRVLAARLREQMDLNPNMDTQTKVAKASGVNQATISRILHCRFAATLDNIEAIAYAFAISPGELLSTHPANFGIRPADTLTDEDMNEIERFVASVRQRRLGKSFVITEKKQHGYPVPRRKRA